MGFLLYGFILIRYEYRLRPIFISTMKRIIPLALLTLMVFMIPTVNADNSVAIQLNPEPEFNQVWAYETYQVNVSLIELNLTTIDFTGYTGALSEILLTGRVNWKGKGGYDFGTATTGYNYNLDEMEVNLNIPLNENYAMFNLTLEKDALDYGIKPFETLEITIRFDAKIVMSDDTLGPAIASKSTTYQMIDETKVDYLNGKYEDMQEEINKVVDASGLSSFNRDRFQGILDDMNASLTISNYFEAFDIWDDYDEDDRGDLINGIIVASREEYAELENLRDVEAQLSALEQQLDLLESEYDQLENTYVALANTYNQVNQDLETVKGNLSTAITAVFLTAIVFYFLGRRGAQREVEAANA